MQATFRRHASALAILAFPGRRARLRAHGRRDDGRSVGHDGPGNAGPSVANAGRETRWPSRQPGSPSCSAGVWLPGARSVGSLSGAACSRSGRSAGWGMWRIPGRSGSKRCCWCISRPAAFWIGILAPLRSLAAGSLKEAAALGRRFGRIAGVTVPVLIAAGIVLAWRLVGDLPALVATGYGLALLAKVTGVGVLLAAAAANRLRFVPAMERGNEQAAAGPPPVDRPRMGRGLRDPVRPPPGSPALLHRRAEQPSALPSAATGRPAWRRRRQEAGPG